MGVGCVTSARGVKALRTVALASVLALAACSSGDHFIVNEAIYVHSGDALKYWGGGCSSVLLPASAPPSNGPQVGDFNFAEGTDGDAFVVRVFSDTELLAERRYNEAMLASEKVDEFSVTTHSSAVYTLRYWGGPCAQGSDASAD